MLVSSWIERSSSHSHTLTYPELWLQTPSSTINTNSWKRRKRQRKRKLAWYGSRANFIWILLSEFPIFASFITSVVYIAIMYGVRWRTCNAISRHDIFGKQCVRASVVVYVYFYYWYFCVFFFLPIVQYYLYWNGPEICEPYHNARTRNRYRMLFDEIWRAQMCVFPVDTNDATASCVQDFMFPFTGGWQRYILCIGSRLFTHVYLVDHASQTEYLYTNIPRSEYGIPIRCAYIKWWAFVISTVD